MKTLIKRKISVKVAKNNAKQYLDQISNLASRANYGYVLTEFFNYVKDQGWIQLTTMRIELYLISPTIRKKKPTNSRFNMRLHVLRSFFKYLQQHDLIEHNTAQFIKSKKTHSQVSHRLLTKNEIKYILRHTNGDAQHAIYIIYHTGLRISELANIRRKDLKTTDGTHILKIIAKGQKPRRLQLHDDIAKVLYQRFFKYNYLANAPLFPSTIKGRCILSSTLTARVRKACAAIGFKNITPHWFRHAFAQQLQHQNIHITQIQNQLGHANINTTQQYLKEMQLNKPLITPPPQLKIDDPEPLKFNASPSQQHPGSKKSRWAKSLSRHKMSLAAYRKGHLISGNNSQN